MGRDRFAPRASVVAQKGQCSSQPSWILSQPRDLTPCPPLHCVERGNACPLAVPPLRNAERGSGGEVRGSGGEVNPAARSTRAGSAPPTTARTAGSAAIVPSSSAWRTTSVSYWFALQPKLWKETFT